MQCLWAQEDSLLLHGPSLGCRELLRCSRSTSCPPSALTLRSAVMLLSHVLTPLSQLLLGSSFSLPSICAPTAQLWQHPVPALLWHGSLLGSVCKGHLCSPLLPKPCPVNPIQLELQTEDRESQNGLGWKSP